LTNNYYNLNSFVKSNFAFVADCFKPDFASSL
jgi:hypothetical protein